MKPLLVGIDVGFGQLKAVTADGRSLCVPSWVAPVPDDSIAMQSGNTVTIDGRTYLVGHDAARMGRAKVPTVDSAWHDEDAFRILFRYACQSFGLQSVRVATGLPVRYFKRNQKAMEERILSFASEDLHVEVAAVVPQPAGTLFAAMFDPDGDEDADFSGRVGIIDIGNGTIDAIECNDQKMSWTQHASEPRGVSRAYEYLHSVVRGRGFNLRITDMPQFVAEPVLFDGGKEVRFDKSVTEAKRLVVQAVDDLVTDLWGSASSLNHVVFTGGGAQFVAEELSTIFRRTKTTIVKEPHLSNARGYVRIVTATREQA